MRKHFLRVVTNSFEYLNLRKKENIPKQCPRGVLQKRCSSNRAANLQESINTEELIN